LWERPERIEDAIRVRGLSPRVNLLLVTLYVPADRTPHPALRATFSRKGRRKKKNAGPKAGVL
jgi:hypothetical protein